MTFLEECMKAEDEERAGKPKTKGKLKIAADTISSTPNDALAKTIKKATTTVWYLNGQGAINDNYLTISYCPGHINI